MTEEQEPVGGSIGNYMIDRSRPLGSPGRFGSVFEARSDSTALAAKIIRLGEGLDAAVVEREVEIARRVDRLEGDRLVKVLDIISTDDEVILIMLRADASLADDISAIGPLGQEDVALAIREIALALADLHGGGIIHRDLKPANILRFGDSYRLADFGISRDIEVATGTVTFQSWGTPPYMAPEQWEGGPLTTKVDLYALGCIAVELATGAPPFTGSNEELREMHCVGTPPDLTGEVPNARLRGSIARMLNKAPNERPQDARAVAERLEGLSFDPTGIERRLSAAFEAHSAERSEVALEEKRLEARAERHHYLQGQAASNFAELMSDAHELIQTSLGDATYEEGRLTLSTDDGSLSVEQDLNVMGEEQDSNYVVMNVLFVGANRRDRSGEKLANAVFSRRGDRFVWTLLRFRCSAVITPGTYRFGPTDREHGLSRLDFRAEHERGHLPRLTGMHVYTVQETDLTDEAIAGLFALALELGS